jgi:starch synthase
MAKLKNLKILFVTSEVAPFVKTGGLGDVSGALPQILAELGHEVRLVVPKYGSVDERRFKIHEIVRLKDIPIHLDNEIELFSLRSSFLSGLKTKVQVYFFDNQKYFGSRKGLYQDIKSKKDYPDNDERYILFCHGIMEMIKKLGWTPDIIHCNDWQSGLIPAYQKTLYAELELLRNTKTVFTIHNLEFQGLFGKETFAKTGLPDSVLSEISINSSSKISFLKAGLRYSDILTTVSEKYAEEIRTIDELAGSMKPILQKRKTELFGIINGIDYSTWNPELDNLIKEKYSSKDLAKKAENKKALLERFKFRDGMDIPIIGTISRLTEQKGIDLIQEAIDDILKLNIKFVMLGQGDKKYHEFFEKIQKKYPDKFAVSFDFDDALAHLIEAGSDMYLMPSRFEPCGLTQLYSLKYGTIPIVRFTGGLADTVEKISTSNGNGTGFVFKKYDSKEMLKEIQHAVKLFKKKALWMKIMRNGMSKDYSWYTSAKKYIELYKKMLKDN